MGAKGFCGQATPNKNRLVLPGVSVPGAKTPRSRDEQPYSRSRRIATHAQLARVTSPIAATSLAGRDNPTCRLEVIP